MEDLGFGFRLSYALYPERWRRADGKELHPPKITKDFTDLAAARAELASLRFLHGDKFVGTITPIAPPKEKKRHAA